MMVTKAEAASINAGAVAMPLHSVTDAAPLTPAHLAEVAPTAAAMPTDANAEMRC